MIAAVAGLSAVAGTTYVYTTDTCLTDSCRSEKERFRQNEIARHWRIIEDGIKSKKVLMDLVIDEFSPIVEQHYNSLNSQMRARIQRNVDHCESFNPGTAASTYCYNEVHYAENRRFDNLIISNSRSMERNRESLAGLRRDAMRIMQSVEILTPENNQDDADHIIKANDNFDNNFSAIMNRMKSDKIVEDSLIDQKMIMLASIKTRISNSLQQIEALERDRSSETQ